VKTTLAAVGLTVLGLAQMAGDVAGLPVLRGLAAATAASPAPKVFSAVQGLETYSSRFTLQWTDAAGRARSLDLEPHVYARILGPYNRRNAYGAVVAYGPVLASSPATRPLFDAVARHAMCGEAPLLRELGVDPAGITDLQMRVTPRPGTDPALPLVLVAPCA
jgi:hypothetical protein